MWGRQKAPTRRVRTEPGILRRRRELVCLRFAWYNTDDSYQVSRFLGREIMRRVLLAVIVLGLGSCPFSVHASATGSGPRVVVRLYPDWKTDAKAYVALTVPLERFEVKADAIRREYARSKGDDESVSGEAIVVVMPEDQQDQAVIDAMQGLVFAQFLRQGTLTLRPGQVPPVQQKPCRFVDASGAPLSDAGLAILIGQSSYSPRMTEIPRVWIADAKLDAEGCLPEAPRSSSGLRHLSFYVMHPDCGPVPAVPQYTSGGQAYHLYRAAALPKDQWCVFVDALGYPMAGVWVEVVTSGSWTHGRMTALDPIRLDGAGRLRPPEVFTALTRCCFVVSDPNYGLALVEPYYLTDVSVHEPLRVCVAPLALYATPADAGSIWGVVVDSDGTAVPGAVIACMSVIAPSGASLKPYWPWPAQWNKEAKVLTNGRGQFAMCLPHTDKDGKLGSPVPRGSLYEVTVTPPAELGCQPFRGRLPAGMEHAIVLEGTAGGPKKYEGLLAFEDEYGPVTDPQKISRVNLVIRTRPGNVPSVSYGYPLGEWLEHSKLPFGIYEATADWDGKHYTFRPMTIRPESPDVIVFRPQKVERYETRYRGRVVHGTSGDPIAGALIMPSDAPGIEQACLDPAAIARLEQQAGPRTVRTDQSGRFEVALPVVARPGPEHTLIAIKSDYLAFRQQRSFITPGREGQRPRSVEFPTDASGRVTLPDMRLFPAGVAIIEPNAPAGHRGKHIMFDLLLSPKSPAWLKSLWTVPEQNSGGRIVCGTEFDLNVRGRQSMRLPAYATLTLRLQLPDERYAPAFIEDLNVGQGQTADLGRIDFARAIPVSVKVIDANDAPLAGVTVLCLAGKGGYPAAETVTNSEGLARLLVASGSSGQFIVECEDTRTGRVVGEGTAYQIGGDEDAPKIFTLPLSNAFLEQYRKPTTPSPGESARR